jgi:MFS family permease
MGLAMLLFSYLDYFSIKSAILVLPALILFNISWGGNTPLRIFLVRKIYGRQKFGTMFGLMSATSLLGSVVGPPFAGWVFDNWQAYNIAWFSLAFLAFLGLTSILTMPRHTVNT